MAVAKEHKLWVIEDCCDALGATYRGQKVGTFGDIATLSFYPAHQMTSGEGGAVFTNNSHLKRATESFRDWGRDCWCMPGKDNTCGKRFLWQLGKLPAAYDHKYIYSHVGYNLKMTDFQGALLVAQLKKLPGFIDVRRRNFKLLHERLAEYRRWLILPEATPGSEPSWFGFLITVREDAGFTRESLVEHLESRKIATRMLFAGNIVKQPMFEGVEHRVVGTMENTERVMRNSFWIGVWPGITPQMYEYVFRAFEEFFAKKR
jgi:CDP-6-deoxy-D-xylo-4-hexulose-3-dehydrase